MSVRKAVAKRDERGMTTAEYAVGTVAVVGFGGVLIKILSDPAVQELIMKILKAIIDLILGLIK